jgi:RHS repeat-associated protein
VECYSYDVFGEPNRTSDVNNPYLFTGRRYDEETGLYYYRARYYAYDIGRFLQTDVVGYGAGLNIYEYVGNNPLNFVDPWGLCKEDTSQFDPWLMQLANGGQILVPPGFDLRENLRKASRMSPFEFYKHVNPGGKWDYKRLGSKHGEITHPEYEDLGNVNYGATGKAVGFPENTLLNEAGRAQQKGTGSGGNPSFIPLIPIGGIAPYGDEIGDQFAIKEGFEIHDALVTIEYRFGYHPEAPVRTVRVYP